MVLLKKKSSFARETGADHGFVLDTFLGKSTGTCPSLAIWEGESLAIELGHLKSSRDQDWWNMWRSAVPPDQKPFNYHGTMPNKYNPENGLING